MTSVRSTVHAARASHQRRYMAGFRKILLCRAALTGGPPSSLRSFLSHDIPKGRRNKQDWGETRKKSLVLVSVAPLKGVSAHSARRRRFTRLHHACVGSTQVTALASANCGSKVCSSMRSRGTGKGCLLNGCPSLRLQGKPQLVLEGGSLARWAPAHPCMKKPKLRRMNWPSKNIRHTHQGCPAPWIRLLTS